MIDSETTKSRTLEDCSICLGHIKLSTAKSSDQILELKACSHYFHESCLTTWLESKNECPLCRTSIFIWQFQDNDNKNCNSTNSIPIFSNILSDKGVKCVCWGLFWGQGGNFRTYDHFLLIFIPTGPIIMQLYMMCISLMANYWKSFDLIEPFWKEISSMNDKNLKIQLCLKFWRFFEQAGK